jgi:hypothetical protein
MSTEVPDALWEDLQGRGLIPALIPEGLHHAG